MIASRAGRRQAGAQGGVPMTLTQEPTTEPTSHRREMFLISLIALVAATAAATTWRAEVAGTRAVFQKQQGVAVEIQMAGDRAADRIDALRGAQDVVNVQALGDLMQGTREASPESSSLGGYAG